MLDFKKYDVIDNVETQIIGEFFYQLMLEPIGDNITISEFDENDMKYKLLVDRQHFDDVMNYIKSNDIYIYWVDDRPFNLHDVKGGDDVCLYMDSHKKLSHSNLDFCLRREEKKNILDPYNLITTY
jgi:hypothetical protein